jgi:hypothetical protein
VSHRVCSFSLSAALQDQHTVEGAWLDSSPYGVVHRIAADGSEGGSVHSASDGHLSNVAI